MKSLCLFLFLCLAVFHRGMTRHPDRPPLEGVTKARELFRLVEGQSSQADGSLGPDEVDMLFEQFDLDGDNRINEEEFVEEWLRRDLGERERGVRMFYRLDTEGDGVVTRFPDVSRVFGYFDSDGDGRITEEEFAIVWSSLSS